MKRFSLYIVREISPLYVAGLVVLLVLLSALFLVQQLADIISRGAPASLVAQFLMFKLPAAAVPGIPLALLFASLLAFTRLGQDSEIKAALFLGLSPRQFAIPMIALGLTISLLSFVNNEAVVPRSEARANEALKNILITSPDVVLQEGNFFQDALGRSIFIERIAPGGVFEGITVIQQGGSGGPNELIQAARGQLDEDAGVWNLETISFRTFKGSRLVLDARADTLALPTRDLTAGNIGRQELTTLPFSELWQRLQNEPNNSPAEWTAFHRKFAEPLAATAFAIFAFAVGLFSYRSSAPLGLVAVLFLTFLYYATWSVANVLGRQGTVPAWTAGWAPVLLYLVAALVLLAVTWRR